jgi:hypothetical protein
MKTLVIAFSLVGAACGGGADPGPEPVTTGTYHHFVTSGVQVPVTPELQNALGIDLDADPQHRPDNRLAGVLIALAGNSDVDLQTRADAALASGQMVMLHSVRADDLGEDASVSWQVYRGGAPAAPPAFDGTDAFEVAASETSPVVGWTANSGFDATREGAGRFTVQLAVSDVDPPIALDLIGARVEGHVDASGCAGKLGGAVTQQDVDTVLLPTVVGLMNAAIERDPGCPTACTPGTSAALIISVFDADHDGVITEQELRDNAIIQSLLEPDVDLIGDDRVKESLSFGMGFDCVAASFAAAGEAP